MGFQTEYDRPPSTMLASISLICGILFCIPGASIAAMICGAVARRWAWADPQRYGGYGMATAGMSLGAVGFGLWGLSVSIGLINMHHAALEAARRAAAQV